MSRGTYGFSCHVILTKIVVILGVIASEIWIFLIESWKIRIFILVWTSTCASFHLHLFFDSSDWIRILRNKLLDWFPEERVLGRLFTTKVTKQWYLLMTLVRQVIAIEVLIAVRFYDTGWVIINLEVVILISWSIKVKSYLFLESRRKAEVILSVGLLSYIVRLFCH